MSKKFRPRKPRNLRGWVSGFLVATTLSDRRDGNNYHWWCFCVRCKKRKELRATQIIRNKQQSCGCLKRDGVSKPNYKHGKGKTRLAAVWRAMMARCYNTKNKRYNCYGGRGLTVCQRWRQSFVDFERDMGTPRQGMVLDRIDNSKGYACGKCDECKKNGLTKCNCHWVTQKENNRNRRDNVLLTIDGETKPLSAWTEKTGIKYCTAWSRLKKGWSPDRAINPNLRRRA